MRQRIYDVQFTTHIPCQQRRVLVYGLKDASAGFGAETHGLVLALNLAVSLNRTLVLPRSDKWWYTQVALCPQVPHIYEKRPTKEPCVSSKETHERALCVVTRFLRSPQIPHV